MYDNTVMSTLVASENPGQQSCCRTLTSHLYTTAYCPLPKNSSCIHVHLHLPITVISQQWPFSYVLNEATVEKFPCLCECCLFVHTCMWASAVCQCVCLSVKLSLYLCVCLFILDNQCAIPSLYSCEVFIHSVSSLCSKLFGHYVTFVFFLGP